MKDVTENSASSDELAILQIAFDEGVRKLQAVQDAAESIRSRAGTLAGAATAVGAFVGGLAIDRGPSGAQWILGVLGFLVYVAAVAVFLSVLLPRKGGWMVGQNTRTLAGVAARETHANVLGQLAVGYQKAFDEAEVVVRRLAFRMQWGSGLMIAQVVLFACLLGLASQNDPLPIPAVPSTEAPTSTQAPASSPVPTSTQTPTSSRVPTSSQGP